MTKHESVEIRKIGNGFISEHRKVDADGLGTVRERFHFKEPTTAQVLEGERKRAAKPEANHLKGAITALNYSRKVKR